MAGGVIKKEAFGLKLRSLAGALFPILAVVAALLVGGVMLLILGASPIAGFGALIDGAFGSLRALSDTAAKAVPLLLVGVGITIAFRSNVINIGGEGQIILGALFGTAFALLMPNLPTWLILPGVLLAGFVGGAFWGAIPGALKAYFNVNEILSTIMLNIVAVQTMNFLLRGPMMDPAEIEAGSRIPQTARLAQAADLPILVKGTRLNAGILISIVAAVVAYFFLWRMTEGFRIRAVGLNPHASRYAGIHVQRSTVLALTLSGALCGLAGAILVFGSESHRFVTDGSSFGFTGSAGYNGIVVALFGGLNPLGTIPASFLFGALLVGANKLQRVVQVPAALIIALNGLVVVFVVSSAIWKRRLDQRLLVRATNAQPDETGPAVAGAPPDE
ncbi:inner membrane ABC transporter permease protein YjfF [bacterium BMS3Bbin01]|nr:inner membrane ABC transporter permease protein YjfF [bacterium BMS3Bbin01]